MKYIFITHLFLISMASCMEISAQSQADKEVLSDLLDEFLAGASVNDTTIHDRFWAEELIYTGSAGTRTTKQEIMNGLKNQAANASDETPVYHAEDLQIQIYGETAIVAFRMIATFDPDSDRNNMQFYNTGSFVKRDGQWKAVAWQATRIPEEL